MKIRTTAGRETELPQEKLDAFKLRLRGPLSVPGDAAYDESRTVWNAMIDRKPALAVRCRGAADVITCVQFARDNDILLCIKGGGHNIAGLATADGALMLDMSLMRSVCGWTVRKWSPVHKLVACLAMWIMKLRYTDSLPFLDSCHSLALQDSPWAVVSAI